MVVHLLCLDCYLRSRIQICDDGSFAEALDDLFLISLVDTWQSVPRSVDNIHISFVHVEISWRHLQRSIHRRNTAGAA